MNGWIKLHRQLMKNKIFRHDITAWHIFEVLMLSVDKKTAEWSGGRYVLADLCGLKPTTTYQALKRLEKAKMVTLSSNNKYTSIRICNWKKYQGNGDTSNDIKVTSNGHQDDTITIIENRELRNIPTVYGKPEINDMFNYWQETTGLTITARLTPNRRAAANLIKKYGQDRLHRLVDGVAMAQSDQYAPRIADFTQLQNKVDELILWGKKSTKRKAVQL